MRGRRALAWSYEREGGVYLLASSLPDLQTNDANGANSMSKVRIVGGRPPIIEVDGVDMAKVVSTVELLMEPGESPRLVLTIPPLELDIETDAEVMTILEGLQVEGAAKIK